jgi:hypothetical protein
MRRWLPAVLRAAKSVSFYRFALEMAPTDH